MHQKYTIRLARPDDAEPIELVQRETWIATYPNDEAGITAADILYDRAGESGELVRPRIEKWRRSIDKISDDHKVYVAEIDGHIVGFSAPGIEKGRRRLGAIYIKPEYQGQGIGTALIQYALAVHAGKGPVYLSVMTYNIPAISIYQKFGFVQNLINVVAPQPLRNGKIMPELEMVRIDK